MSTALIGYTGFVGSTLLNQTQFSDLYNSKNITEIKGKTYEKVVCAGAPAVKWKANQNPQEDIENLEYLMSCLKEVNTSEFILISTVDVYKSPKNVDEDCVIDANSTDPYGKHRFFLEQFVSDQFLEHSIIRLPGLFGKGLKKNFIYDLMHTNCLHLTHCKSVFQFYDMSKLWEDLQTVSNNRLHLVNFATEPVSAEEIAKACFDIEFTNETEKKPVNYDMHTKFSTLFNSKETKYMSDKNEVLEQIRSFVNEESWSLL